MPADQVAKLPGYDPDVPKSREEARQIMHKLGYGPDPPARGQPQAIYRVSPWLPRYVMPFAALWLPKSTGRACP